MRKLLRRAAGRVACALGRHERFYESANGRVRLEAAWVDRDHTREQVVEAGFGRTVCRRCDAVLVP